MTLGKSLIGNPGTAGEVRKTASIRAKAGAEARLPGGHRFFIVDVFGECKYSGNQLAVVLPARKLETAEMQAIAREFNFSETTFIPSVSPRQGAYAVRIFTPRGEVPFAGHPCLGTAHIILKHLAKPGTRDIVLDLKAGRIPVRCGDDGAGLLWMRQLAPVFGKTHDAKAFAKVLGLDPGKAEKAGRAGRTGSIGGAGDFDARFPIQQVSTGMEFLLVPLKNLAAVEKAATDMAAYRKYFLGQAIDAATGARGLPIFLFCAETRDPANRIHARMFADMFGIPEDPATGSANGCLAGYLIKHGYFGKGPVRVSVEQGYEMGRNSILHIDARAKGRNIEVQVGGKVFDVAEGRLV